VHPFQDVYQPLQFGRFRNADGQIRIGFYQGEQGANPPVNGNVFTAVVDTPVNFGGSFALLQFTNSTRISSYANSPSDGIITNGFVLDNTAAGFAANTPYYNASASHVAANQANAAIPQPGAQTTNDSPSEGPLLADFSGRTPLAPTDMVYDSVNDQFKTLLTFQPDGGKPVGLGMISWGISGVATLTKNADGSFKDATVVANWQLSGPLPPGVPGPPAPAPTPSAPGTIQGTVRNFGLGGLPLQPKINQFQRVRLR